VPTDSAVVDPAPSADVDSEPPAAAQVPTDSGPTAEPAADRRSIEVITRSRCEPYRPFIVVELAKGRHGVAIYEDLVEHHGFEGALDSVKRFIRLLRKEDPKVFCRFETEPGEEAQVDFGEGAPTRHPRTGRWSVPGLFVFTLVSGLPKLTHPGR
jgi:hypothetical protein